MISYSEYIITITRKRAREGSRREQTMEQTRTNCDCSGFALFGLRVGKILGVGKSWVWERYSCMLGEKCSNYVV